MTDKQPTSGTSKVKDVSLNKSEGDVKSERYWGMMSIKRFFGTPLSYRMTFWDLVVFALLVTGIATWVRWFV